jgi:hypothetical protein
MERGVGDVRHDKRAGPALRLRSGNMVTKVVRAGGWGAGSSILPNYNSHAVKLFGDATQNTIVGEICFREARPELLMPPRSSRSSFSAMRPESAEFSLAAATAATTWGQKETKCVLDARAA